MVNVLDYEWRRDPDSGNAYRIENQGQGHVDVVDVQDSHGMTIAQNEWDSWQVLQAPPLDPDITRMLRYFNYDHLPAPQAAISQLFHDLANQLAVQTSGPETRVGMHKLLEAKDSFVRASLDEAIS